MKKLLCLLLTIAVLFSLAGCGSKKEEQPPQSDTAQDQTETLPSQDSLEPAESGPADDAGKENEGGSPVVVETPEETADNTEQEQPPVSQPEQPAPPADDEPPEETPADEPAVSNGALALLDAAWNTCGEEERFPAAGGDAEHAVDSAPGSFDVANTDSLIYQLTFPEADVSLIDAAASLVHMMNMNTFTCGAFHVTDAGNVSKLADDLRDTIQSKRWMCGFPDKLVILTAGEYVVSLYGNEELVNTFSDALQSSNAELSIAYDEAIGG